MPATTYQREELVRAEDDKWLVIECSRCCRYFDVPRPTHGRRLRELCDECKHAQKLLSQKQYIASRR